MTRPLAGYQTMSGEADLPTDSAHGSLGRRSSLEYAFVGRVFH